jgi:hypothetical protein
LDFIAGDDAAPAAGVAGATEAALYFVEEEEEVVLVAERLHGAEEFRCGRVDAAFTLDGFEHDGDGALGDGGAERFDVVECGVDEAGHDRAEATVDFFLGGGAHGAEGATVEAA